MVDQSNDWLSQIKHWWKIEMRALSLLDLLILFRWRIDPRTKYDWRETDDTVPSKVEK